MTNALGFVIRIGISHSYGPGNPGHLSNKSKEKGAAIERHR
jgi:hypothetical protein